MKVVLMKSVLMIQVTRGQFWKKEHLPTSARDSKKTVQVGRGSNRMKSARTMSEAIDGLKNRLQQGIAIDSYMFEAVLEAGRPYSSRASSWVHH
jgi:hypothetical protein